MKLLIVILILNIIYSITSRKIFPGEFPVRPRRELNPTAEKVLKTSCKKLEGYNQDVYGGFMEVGD